MFQYLIPALSIADDLYDLAKIINRSPLKKNDRLVKLKRNEDTNKLDDIELDLTKSDDVIDSLTNAVKGKRENSIKKEIEPVSSIPKVTENSGDNLLSALTMRNKISQENNSLLRRQVEQAELGNELLSAKIFSDYESSTAILISLENLGREIKIKREFQELSTIKNSDNMEKYFGSLGSFYKFQTTGEIDSEADYFGRIEPVNIKDSNDDNIVPMEVEAKHNAEKAIETKAMNKTEIDISMIDSIFDLDDLNPFTSLIDEVKESMQDMNNSLYSNVTNIPQGTTNG